MITIDNKYELGQEVYVIRKEKKTIWNKKTCDMCLGIGRIVLSRAPEGRRYPGGTGRDLCRANR